MFDMGYMGDLETFSSPWLSSIWRSCLFSFVYCSYCYKKYVFYVQEMSYLASRISKGEMGCMGNLETWTEDVMSRSSFADLVKF
jgi:hypothetical protein